jgi:ceramide glucosyltransferase
MGSTIALSRTTLDRIGGFTAFSDTLADDFAMGQAVRGLGLEVGIPPMLVTHGCAETSFAELWRHEMRWGVTVRGITPGAYAASLIALPLPLAAGGALLVPHHGAGAALVVLALIARYVILGAVNARTRQRPIPFWLIPVRDCLSFAVFIASFFARSVDWRGQTLKMRPKGLIAANPETPA